MTDHGSIRFRCSRARLGPRVAAPATVARAERSVSETRAAPTAAAPVTAPVTPRAGDAGAGRLSGLVSAPATTGARPMVLDPPALDPPEAPAGRAPDGPEPDALDEPEEDDEPGG